jgi:hypothetical protein
VGRGPLQGYRMICDEPVDDGWEVSERPVWRVCSHVLGCASLQGPSEASSVGAAVHDDLVETGSSPRRRRTGCG